MKIPENIEILIQERADLASRLNIVDYRLSNWLEDNGIILDSSDYKGGIEIFTNPYDSSDRVRQAIKDKE